MYWAHYRAEQIVWTRPVEGSGRSMAWREQYLPRLYPPCVVDRLHVVTTEMILVDENNSGCRCACVRGILLGIFSAGRILLISGGSVDCCGLF